MEFWPFRLNSSSAFVPASLWADDKLVCRHRIGIVPGSPLDLNTGNGIEGAMVCTSLGSLLRPQFYFLCSNLKANPVLIRPWYLASCPLGRTMRHTPTLTFSAFWDGSRSCKRCTVTSTTMISSARRRSYAKSWKSQNTSDRPPRNSKLDSGEWGYCIYSNRHEGAFTQTSLSFFLVRSIFLVQNCGP